MIYTKIKENSKTTGKKYEFSDILDFVEYASSGEKSYEYSSSRFEGNNKFAGGTWQDALYQAKTGNPELVKTFFDGVNVISAMIEQEEIGEMRDVTGEYFDVADYLSGEPEVFRRKEYGDQKPVIPVYASFAMACHVSKEEITNRGCGIIALCDELQKSGFIVDLNIVHTVEYKSVKYYTKIKVGTDPIDLDTAAFILANPLCLRRLWFGALEHATGERDCGGYGHPCEYDLNEIFDTGLSGFYFTSSNHDAYKEADWKTPEGTKEHIVGMIEKFKESAEQVILG